ncbi:hypothetical protein KC19_N040100 [Ceratodon purpureus]|nr:hypothetical protein KC19_N040100 [Ceratodon purpureus]
MADLVKSTVTSPTMKSDRKRKAEEGARGIVKVGVQRRYHLDTDILECPVCFEQFSSLVYQCQNGHSVCSACHAKIRQCPTCSKSIKTFIRNLLAEKIVESLKSSCPYTHYGCRFMAKVSVVEDHMKYFCTFRPCPCPVSGCTDEVSKGHLPEHLEMVHEVPIRTLGFIEGNSKQNGEEFSMSFADQFVMLKAPKERIQLLVHQEVIKGLGNIFFCTCFEDHTMKYDLRVSSLARDGKFCKTSIHGALAHDIREREVWKKDILFFSRNDPTKTGGIDYSRSDLILSVRLNLN